MPKRFTNYGNPRPKTFDWRTIFLQNSGGISSKRVCGVFGWMVCLGLLIAAYVAEKEIPGYAEMIAAISAALLGVDSITGIWQKTIQKQ